MLYFWDGQAYLVTDKGAAAAGRGLVELESDTVVGVVPWNGSPSYSFCVRDVRAVNVGAYLHAALPAPPTPRLRPTRILASTVDGAVRACVTDNGQGCLWIDTERESLCHPLPAGLDEPLLRLGSVDGVATVAVSARLGRGYYLLVAQPDGGLRVRIDTPCLRYEQTDGRTLVLTQDSPCGTLGTVRVYDRTFTPVEDYPVQTGLTTTDDRALLLAEYALTRNAGGLASVAAPELYAAMTVEDFAHFFSPYRSVQRARPHPEGTYLLVKDDGSAELCRFASDRDGRITDVTDYTPPPAFFENAVQL